MYVAFYCHFDKTKKIADIINKYGKNITKIVYRGQGRNSGTINKRTPFFSTSPNKAMAEIFVEMDWEKNRKVGHLFKIHLVNHKVLSTRDINYTLSKKVKEFLVDMLSGQTIQKGSGSYTIRQYLPELKKLLYDLVYCETTGNSEEILVLNKGVFYKDKYICSKGFMKNKKGELETWFVN